MFSSNDFFGSYESLFTKMDVRNVTSFSLDTIKFSLESP